MKKKTKPLLEKSDDELKEMLLNLQQQYFRRRFTADPKRIENPGKFQNIKKQIARIKTILRERELEEEFSEEK